MSDTKKTALSGVFAALCVALLLLVWVIPTLDLTVAALASFVVLVALIELGPGHAIGVYAAAAVLSIILLPVKAPALYFTAFSGYYPILKILLNRIKPKWLSWVARIAVFNIAAAAIIAIGIFVLGYENFLSAFMILFMILANAAFVVYDLALERMTVFYLNRIRNHIFKGRR